MVQTGIDADLCQAIENQSLQAYYQPIISLQDGSINGFEVLARWERDGCHIPPHLFIQAAEKSGLIITVGEYILTRACLQLKHWMESGLVSERYFISVNLSGRQLAQPDFAERIEEILHTVGLAGCNLRFEISEVTRNDRHILSGNLHHLKALGILCSIDNFKNDKASVDLLQQLPFDILKIDRSFMSIAPLNRQEQISALHTVISQSHHLGLRVVAEGVEDEKILHMLCEMGCEYAQGYYFSPPVNPRKAGQILIGDPRWQHVLH